jgi:glycerol-3-phosphate acyltransferase PlsY
MGMINNLLFIGIGYLLGSIPFGYLFTKIWTGKNILEIGWRKTSGSNVFRNVGFWPGFLTGIFDIGKGALAVYLARYFGQSFSLQVLSGLAAIIGHNWSIFLKFAGGRGIGTFLGAFWVLTPQLFLYSLLPTIFLALIWNAAIATIFLLFISILLAWRSGQLATSGLLPLLSLLPIFLKRLSPIKELSLKRKEIIRNRLIFDDDIPKTDLRIIKIFQHLTKK